MVGLPGSGKTTKAKKWIALHAMIHSLSEKKHFAHISASDYFVAKNDDDDDDDKCDRFEFDGRSVQASHEWCIALFKEQIESSRCDGDSLQFIVVDNCHLTLNDVKPYVDVIKKKNQGVGDSSSSSSSSTPSWDFIFLEPNTEWKWNAHICANKTTHNVPLKTIEKMASKRQVYDKRDFAL